jgi:hypothetical protein
VLSLSPGAWSLSPSRYGYAWLRCDPNGRHCTPVAGATASTYTVQTSDSGYTLVGEIEAVGSSSSQTALSAATPLID